MLLFQGEGLSKGYGSKELFSDLSLSIFANDRIGLIGQNGSGKSTLLKIIAGEEVADRGNLSLRKGLKIGYVPQFCELGEQKPIELLLEVLKKETSLPDYEKEQKAKVWLSKLGFTGEEPVASQLSGGWKKRAMIAREMVLSPDLLLLDEPTNHLDIEGILWLEKFLKMEVPTYLLVSHDRYFLQHMTNRMIEIGSVYPKGLFAIDGPYAHFLTKKEEFLAGQLQQERSLASKVRREKEWLRSNPKARTSKSQARIDQAYELLNDFSKVQERNIQKKAALDFVASERETRKLLTAKNISKEIHGKVLFHHLDLLLSPGTRLGLMGPNGSGKTTLLHILASELSPDQGTIKRVDDLKTVYFDQHRMQLPLEMPLREALSPNKDYVTFRGQQIHVNGWCKRFLFSPDLLDLPIGRLSGGERARIAIAHLMLQPADILLLDEPTNDLDIPTLETLELNLLDFQGAVVLITHDRCMLDKICNQFLTLGAPPLPLQKEQPEQKSPVPQKTKLSYKEKKEFEQIEEKIEALEKEMKEWNRLLESPEITSDSAKLSNVCSALAVAEVELERLYLRWEELEKLTSPQQL